MIKTTVLAGETYRSTTRPAIFASIKRLLDLYSLDDSLIYYNGETEISKLVGSLNTDKRGSDNYTDLKNINKLFVLAKVEYSEFNSMYGNSYRQRTHTSVWKDDETLTDITPQYEGRKVEVDINKHFRTRQEAVNFVNKLNTATTTQLADFTFDADIHYPINYSIIDLLTEIYNRLVCGGKIDSCEINFGKWFSDNCLVPYTVISNIIGNNKIPVIPRRIEETILQMNSPTVEQIVKGEYSGRFEVSFSYNFYWQEFIGWELTYPLMVYQKIIPEKYIPMPVKEHNRSQAANRFLENSYMQDIRFGNSKSLHSPYYDKIPSYDPYTAPYQNFLTPKLQITLTVEDVPEQILLNLKEIPNYSWNPFYLYYLIKYRSRMLILNKSPIHFKVFSGDVQILNSDLTIDDEGNVWLLRNPFMKNQHTFVMYVNYAIRDWDDDAVDDIINFPDDSSVILPDIMPWYRWPDYLNPGGGNVDNLGIWLNAGDWDNVLLHNDPGRGLTKDRPFPPHNVEMGFVAINGNIK